MKISIILEALTGKFETDMNRAAKTTEKRMKEIRASAVKLGKEIGLALAAGATGVAFAIKGAIDRADELKNTADKIGLTTEALSRLEFAAKQSGVELDQLQSAFVKMTKFQAEAVNTQSEAATVFKEFGIAVKDQAGNLRSGQDVFRDFAEVLSKLDTQSRNAIGLKVFGKSFADLVPLIQGGAKGLDDFAAASDKAGATVSNEFGEKADAFNDKLDALKLTISGIAVKIADDLMPALNDIVDRLQDMAQSGEAVEDLKSIFTVVGTAAKILGAAVQLVVDGIQSLVSIAGAGFSAASAQLNLLRGNFKQAKIDFDAARGEMDAAIRAGAESRKNLGLDLGLPGDETKPGAPVVAPHGHAGSNARGGRANAASAAEAAAKRILDAENARRKASEAAAASAKAGAKAEAEARKAATEAAQKQKDAEEALQEKIKEQEDATKEFSAQLEDLTAHQQGPVAEANLEYQRQVQAIKDTFAKTELPAAQLTQALQLMADAHEKDVQAIKERLDPAQQYLKDLQTELDLINAKTQAERDAIEFRKQFPTATEAQADAAARMKAQLDETQQVIENNNELRQSFEDTFVSILDGSKSAGEAFKDFADSIVQQLLKIAAQKAAIALFGEPNTAGGGLLGNLLSFLPGFAGGTNFAPGGLAVVGEHGPEVVNLPRGSQVVPTNQVGAMGRNVQININVDGATTKETAQQIATKVAGAVAFAGRAA